MFIPGQIENWIMILNFAGTSPLTLPDAVKKLIKTLSDNFLSRLYKCYVFGMSIFIKFIYRIICTFLEEITVQKLTILDSKNHNILFRNIRSDNVEQKFGGIAPDVTLGVPHSIFPPLMPSSFFLKEDENPKEILITEEEYINLVENKKIEDFCISPYIKIKLENMQKQINFEFELKKSFSKKDWKFQNEFEKNNKMKNLNKSNNNFNFAKNSFHKSINLINDKK